MKIYGTASVTENREGYLGRTTYLKVTPKKKWSWGIEPTVFVDGRFIVKDQRLNKQVHHFPISDHHA